MSDPAFVGGHLLTEEIRTTGIRQRRITGHRHLPADPVDITAIICHRQYDGIDTFVSEGMSNPGATVGCSVTEVPIVTDNGTLIIGTGGVKVDRLARVD